MNKNGHKSNYDSRIYAKQIKNYRIITSSEHSSYSKCTLTKQKKCRDHARNLIFTVKPLPRIENPSHTHIEWTYLTTNTRRTELIHRSHHPQIHLPRQRPRQLYPDGRKKPVGLEIILREEGRLAQNKNVQVEDIGTINVQVEDIDVINNPAIIKHKDDNNVSIEEVNGTRDKKCKIWSLCKDMSKCYLTV
ncbi:hypothetical protein C1645_832846 [Glomus cerebriforme]|uniref:Uncharacterized protein n=1 Tax=Glomus cerebriforme TaxID=658196 RepID=A0A397SMK2_9GLOM|nr:hypothetical protein C1645_832846 [Glomus cerebriforme]